MLNPNELDLLVRASAAGAANATQVLNRLAHDIYAREFTSPHQIPREGDVDYNAIIVNAWKDADAINAGLNPETPKSIYEACMALNHLHHALRRIVEVSDDQIAKNALADCPNCAEEIIAQVKRST